MRRVKLMSFLAIAGCSSPSEPRITDVLELKAESGDLVITNHSRQPLATFVIDREFMATANWIFCPEPETCTAGQPAGSSSRRPLSTIWGYRSGGTIVVIWKEVGQTNDGRKVFLREGVETIRP